MGRPHPYTDEITFRWDAATECLLVLHPNRTQWPDPIAQVSSQTLAGMTWPDASRFIGEFVTLLIPELRRRYEPQFPDSGASDP